jgi:solute carrier family 25 (mitochondrial phosphate transporter), member 3
MNPLFSNRNNALASPNEGYSSNVFAQSPFEPSRGKIEMFSNEYYAAGGVGGALCCGITHTAITPLDVVKCNMQVMFNFIIDHQ